MVNANEPLNPTFGRIVRALAGLALVSFLIMAVLRLLDAPPRAGVARVAFVVGLHFIPFASTWRQRSILVPAHGLTALGVIGLIMALTSAVAWTPSVSGVLSGFTPLAGSLYVASRLPRSSTANSPAAN
ncbi:hypothetical protein [Amycolatopsis sp. YIM 10]|uniref:hypothetical protein n=1 Tax=Amycolatopsis sp. YIM 10 TaxID=2653857 RepID=UPI0012905D5D|nr:hypothetical protein [Amycolatopsis sp. YIM 10]QFU92435.1 hypothetical protein YIM_36380 [Amycolatopsis sp. YIM 10]